MPVAPHQEQGRPIDSPLCERALTALSKAGEVLRSQKRKALRDLHLTPTQAQILTILAAARGEHKRLNDVAEALGVSAPTASEAVATLLRKKLVAREAADGDRRALSLGLTPRGMRVAGFAASWPEPVVTALRQLSPQELPVLFASIVRVLRAFETARLIPTVRMCPSCLNFRRDAHADPERPHHCALMNVAIGNVDVRFDCTFHTRQGAPSPTHPP